VAWASVDHVRRQRATESAARAAARTLAASAAAAIDQDLRAVTPLADAIARDLSAGRLRQPEIAARLAADLAAHAEPFELGVAYLPFATDPRVRLFAPHVARLGGGLDSFQLETRYDYTTYAWYADALRSPGWGEPYFGEATRTLVVGYAVPFTRPGGAANAPIGVVRVNLSLESIRALVSSTSLGETGYGFLLSRKGIFLAYPDERLVVERRSALDVARQLKDDARADMTARALRGEPSEGMTVSAMTGQAIWLVHQTIASTGWVLGVASFVDEATLEARDLRHGYVRILCGGLAALFFIAVLLLRVERAEHSHLWSGTISAAVLLGVGIVGLWYLTLQYPDRNAEASVHILDHVALQKFLASHARKEAGRATPTQIRTGILVRTWRFIDANDVAVTGRIWQRIPVAARGRVTPGLDMPDAEAFTLREPATVDDDDGTVTTWTFTATLREPSEWSQKYPFDRALMRVRILPKPSSVPVVLIPDLLAYDLLMPSAMPGVEPLLVLPGWRLDHSYFSYVARGPLTTDMAGVDQTLAYDMAFNVVAQRRFLDPFVSSVLPIIVIVCLLFGLLIVGSKNNEKVAATGFKATDVLRASVALLFPALIAQVNLRSKIDANQIIYIEYFYFVLYLSILGVAANALAFTLSKVRVAQVRDNLIPKLVFWPAILGACFAVSLWFLY